MNRITLATTLMFAILFSMIAGAQLVKLRMAGPFPQPCTEMTMRALVSLQKL